MVSASATSSSDRFPELEKFELLEEIGHGGMATVYRARDLRLDREVAIKIIHKHLRENPEVRRRFVAEARAVAKLRHPGIVDVYDVSDEEDESRYLVVELIRGTNLRKMLHEHEALPAEVAAIIISLLCGAVQHAHEAGVIHRDIKPENVLVELPRHSMPPPGGADDADEELSVKLDGEDQTSPARTSLVSSSARSDRNKVRIKLTDFGIAKVLDVQGVTSTGQILGSPAHMAPEQIEGGRVGPQTDVFALGVLMYECMVGHLPFEGRNPAQVLRKVLEGIYEQADSEAPQVGGRWARIIAQALHVDIDKRIASAEALAALIEQELQQLEIDDPSRLLTQFFDSPSTCRERLSGQLVGHLLKRGEQERKRGRVQLTAADFNRALAFRPDDLTILKRVSSLSAQAAWKQRVSRTATILLGSAALGGAAFGITRLVRPALGPPLLSSHLSALPLPTSKPLVVKTAAPTSTRSASVPTASVSAVAVSSSSPRIFPVVDAGAPSSGQRARVRFHLIPGGAAMTLGGKAISWYQIQELEPRSYTAKLFMKGGDPCCESRTVPITILPPDPNKPNGIQRISLKLTIKNARATLVGAPKLGSMSCGKKIFVSAGGTGTAIMDDVTWSGTCVFKPGNASRAVRLHAGKTARIAWPGP